MTRLISFPITSTTGQPPPDRNESLRSWKRAAFAKRIRHNQERLLDAPNQAITFLRVVASSAEIRTRLEAVGYGDKDRDEAWEMLRDCLDERGPLSVGGRWEAVVELKCWGDALGQLCEAKLASRYRAQQAAVLEALRTARVRELVRGCELALDCLDRLDGAGLPGAASIQDRRAVAALARWGITTMERARVRELVRVAQVEAGHVNSLESVILLRAWLDAWTRKARTVLPRRQLEQLGVGGRGARALA